MGHKERIRRYRTEGGGADLVRVEVLVPVGDRDRIVSEAARLREAYRAQTGGRKAVQRVDGARMKVLSRLAPKYVWWELSGSDEQWSQRVLAQIMDLGTYDDILAIEAVFDGRELIDILNTAQPGWFSPRSWEFWRGRLSSSENVKIPRKPPQRTFDAHLL